MKTRFWECPMCGLVYTKPGRGCFVYMQHFVQRLPIDEEPPEPPREEDEEEDEEEDFEQGEDPPTDS